MCRLFGFRSVIPSQVHRSLMDADNALGFQSNEHPDGWGVAYYVDGAPHIARSPATALSDHLFRRVSGVVSSETVLAHVRRATVGNLSVLNCHPFQYGRWIFAHNGEIAEFEQVRDKVRSEVSPRLRRFILGDTDSEVIFFLFLTHLASRGKLSERMPAEDAMEALRATVNHVRQICDGREGVADAFLTIIVTDGTTFVATQGGKELHLSTYKTQCSDRDSCPHLADECEAPTRSGFVNHLVLSSEPIQGENVWIPLEQGDLIGVDWHMKLQRGHVDRRQLEVLAS